MASEKIMNFVEEIKKLSVLELSELVDAIQEEFGVTAAVAAAPAAGAAGADLCSGFYLQQPLGRDLDRAGPALLLAGAAGAGHRPDIPPA